MSYYRLAPGVSIEPVPSCIGYGWIDEAFVGRDPWCMLFANGIILIDTTREGVNTRLDL